MWKYDLEVIKRAEWIAKRLGTCIAFEIVMRFPKQLIMFSLSITQFGIWWHNLVCIRSRLNRFWIRKRKKTVNWCREFYMIFFKRTESNWFLRIFKSNGFNKSVYFTIKSNFSIQTQSQEAAKIAKITRKIESFECAETRCYLLYFPFRIERVRIFCFLHDKNALFQSNHIIIIFVW